MSEKICRLCLQTIIENHQAIEKSVLKTLKLNLSISKEAVMCIECANYLQVFPNLKPARVYTRDSTLPLTDLKSEINSEPVEFENTDNSKSLMDTGKNCSFCIKTNGKDLASLNGSKENEFLVNMLKQHIPEMNLKDTEELLTCETCHDTLQGVLSFVLKCSEVEERINKYTETEGTDDKGQIELKDVQQFVFSPTVKFEVESFGGHEPEDACYQMQKDSTMRGVVEAEHEQKFNNFELIIKREIVEMESELVNKADDGYNTKPEDVIVKIENTDTVSEHGYYDSFQDPFVEYKIAADPSETSEMGTKEYTLTPTSASEVAAFKCDMCSYETKRKGNLKQHLLTHKSPTNLNMFKCKTCSYEAKRKYHLKQHLLTHKNPAEVNTFKCEMCSYQAKRKEYLQKHLLTHKSSEEVTMFKCEMCSFITKRKYNLTDHLLMHKSSSEVPMFKCEMCPYETKRKYHLKQHLLTHNNPSVVNTFKCEICSFNTKRKDCLKNHLLTHKSSSEATVFTCEMCPFNTKCKYHLKNHLLTHRSPSEIPMFKCEFCSYQATRKDYLRQHSLVHKSPSEVNMFKCKLCSYEAKQKCYLKSHLLTHRSSSEGTMFKCEFCSHQTKHKQYLKRHLLTHKSPSEVNMFKCEMCSFNTKRKHCLQRHLLTHRSPAEAKMVKCEMADLEQNVNSILKDTH